MEVEEGRVTKTKLLKYITVITWRTTTDMEAWNWAISSKIQPTALNMMRHKLSETVKSLSVWSHDSAQRFCILRHSILWQDPPPCPLWPQVQVLSPSGYPKLLSVFPTLCLTLALVCLMGLNIFPWLPTSVLWESDIQNPDDTTQCHPHSGLGLAGGQGAAEQHLQTLKKGLESRLLHPANRLKEVCGFVRIWSITLIPFREKLLSPPKQSSKTVLGLDLTQTSQEKIG